MAIKRLKDRTNLISKTKIRAHNRRHYLFCYLWVDKESLVQNSGTDIAHLSDSSRTQACHCPNPYTIKFDEQTWEGVQLCPSPLLGEVHFIQGRWDMEVVAHELLHAILHRIRSVGPPIDILMSQSPMAAEEAVCYEFGEWLGQVYRWLWKVDPSERWQRVADDDRIF